MDPFYEVLADANQSLDHARSCLSAYEANPSIDTLRDVNNTMQELTETAHDLSQSVASAQREPSRFGVDVAEISSRISQVGQINHQISEIQELLNQIQTSASTHRAAAAAATSAATAPPPSDPFAIDEASDSRQFLYQQAIQEQDNVLDDVHDTVATLREQAQVMSRELEDHAMMLEDFEEQAESAGDKLKRGMKRVDWVLRNNRETLSTCCITLLIVALIVLLVLVIIV